MSDAGTPGISDPGSVLVSALAVAGAPVSVVPGPSSVVAALVVSGLPTDRFCVEGFLPRKGGERRERVAAVMADRRTTVIMEAPGRVAATLGDLAALDGDRPVAVVRELTKIHEEVWRGALTEAAGGVRGAWGPGRGGAGGRWRTPPEPTGDDDIEAAVRRRLAQGDGPRQVSVAVAAELGWRAPGVRGGAAGPGRGRAPPA